MYYDCISLDISLFLKGPKNGRAPSMNIPAVVEGISACSHHFRFALVDIGPWEAFVEYDILRNVVRMVRAIDFTPRLLTTGRCFSDGEAVRRQFIELVQLGVGRIILRVDRRGAESLPETHLKNYVKGCLASGIVPEVRLDLDDPVSEPFFELVRRMEQASFYTTIRPKVSSDVERATFDPAKPIRHDANSRRIVISEDGGVLLREYDEGTTETYLGNLSEKQLPVIIDPIRLAYGRGGALT